MYFPMPPIQAETFPQMTKLLVYDGNAARGAEVFARATCTERHKIGEAGTDWGPDLSKIGSKLPKRGPLGRLRLQGRRLGIECGPLCQRR